jgi:hypothetical protein
MSACLFFNDKMGDKPATAEMLKQRYCFRDKNGCARYMVRSALGKDNVPADLYPNQKDKALLLIGK